MKRPPLLTLEDVADLFKVTTKTIERWVDKGLMEKPWRVIGRNKYWHPDQFAYGTNQDKSGHLMLKDAKQD